MKVKSDGYFGTIDLDDWNLPEFEGTIDVIKKAAAEAMKYALEGGVMLIDAEPDEEGKKKSDIKFCFLIEMFDDIQYDASLNDLVDYEIDTYKRLDGLFEKDSLLNLKQGFQNQINKIDELIAKDKVF